MRGRSNILDETHLAVRDLDEMYACIAAHSQTSNTILLSKQLQIILIPSFRLTVTPDGHTITRKDIETVLKRRNPRGGGERPM